MLRASSLASALALLTACTSNSGGGGHGGSGHGGSATNATSATSATAGSNATAGTTGSATSTGSVASTGSVTSAGSASSVASSGSVSTSSVASTGSVTSTSSAGSTSSSGAPVDASIASPCSLPGSVVFTKTGSKVVPGGAPTWPDLTFLHLPIGFCAHYYGTVGDARQMRFAPGGELFVASPGALTTGGNSGAGLGAIVVLPDDNLDGVADSTLTFVSFGNLALHEPGHALRARLLLLPGR